MTPATFGAQPGHRPPKPAPGGSAIRPLPHPAVRTHPRPVPASHGSLAIKDSPTPVIPRNASDEGSPPSPPYQTARLAPGGSTTRPLPQPALSGHAQCPSAGHGLPRTEETALAVRTRAVTRRSRGSAATTAIRVLAFAAAIIRAGQPDTPLTATPSDGGQERTRRRIPSPSGGGHGYSASAGIIRYPLFPLGKRRGTGVAYVASPYPLSPRGRG